MVEQHEQQHVETMLATHQLRDGAPLLGAGSPLPPGRPRAARTRCWCRPGRSCWGSTATDEPWSLDNERPAHTVDLPAFRIARVPVTNAEWQAFIEAGGYDEPRWWSERGWRHRVEAGLERPLFWSRGRLARRFGHVEEIPAGRAGAARLLLRGRGLCGLGGRPAADRAGVGEGLRLGPGAGSAGGAGRGATRSGRPRWPTSAARRCGPRPWAPTRGGASAYGVEQLIGDVWEWTSSGSSLAGLHADALRRLQRPVLRRRLPGAARRLVGGRRRLDAAVVPQLGPARSAGRSSAACGWPGTLCRHLAWLGEPARCPRWCWTRRSGCCGSPTQPRRQRRGLLNADGWGVGFFTPGRTAPVRWRSARPLWSDASFASVAPVLRSGAVVAAVRSATVGMPIDESAAAPFTDGRLAALAQRSGGPLGAAARHDAESVCDSALLAAHVFAEGVDQSPRRCRRSPPPTRRLAEPPAHRPGRILAVTWGDPILPHRARRRGRGERALDDDPALGRRAGPAPARVAGATRDVTVTPLET